VIYLVFNEGYAASSGPTLTRASLSEEAIRLGRLLMALLPDAEVIGLLALMLLQASRRAARTSPTGDLILLEDQDRSLWNREQIIEGLTAFWNEGFCQTTTWPMLPRPIYGDG
jgi:RNA polymerase sigma-70 factor (ECF subfamily)